MPQLECYATNTTRFAPVGLLTGAAGLLYNKIMESGMYTEHTVPCQVRNHHHMCTFVRRDFQEGTGQEAWTVECPTGMYRFFHIVGYHGAEYPIEGMPRTKRPRWGWGIKPPVKTKYQGTSVEQMGY